MGKGQEVAKSLVSSRDSREARGARACCVRERGGVGSKMTEPDDLGLCRQWCCKTLRA